jgi:putative chitinase
MAPGEFDAKTAEAVRAFQRQQGLTDDGLAGPLTLEALGLR